MEPDAAVERTTTHDASVMIADAWAQLVRATHDRKHGFRQVGLATIGLDGWPRVRTVVLRGAEEAGRWVRMHTDARSPKVREIAADPRVAVLAYDRSRKLQVRLEGRAAVHRSGEVADRAWARTPLMSRRCYLAPGAPSEVREHVDANLPPELTTRDPTADESEAGRSRFAVVEVAVERVDALHLAHAGHARCGAIYANEESRYLWLSA